MSKKDFIFIGVVTLIVFAFTYSVLAFLGFIPKEFQVNNQKQNQNATTTNFQNDPTQEIIYPDRIIISKIGVNSVIQKPQSQDVAVLDNALTKGAVYYPGSGTINFGNIFLFGHSTNWQVVNNQAYKTFNDLDKLVQGDEIKIEALAMDGQIGSKTYIYKVDNVKLLDDSAAFVDFSKNKRMLTISTCNTFGKKQERWVVEAYFDRELE